MGNVAQADMLTTFNCGIGMIVCVAAEDEAQTLDILRQQGETVYAIGQVIPASQSAVIYT